MFLIPRRFFKAVHPHLHLLNALTQCVIGLPCSWRVI
eukprot:COSAG02_NODE_50288_length_321_cov_1.009009_1_plen_36_part_10